MDKRWPLLVAAFLVAVPFSVAQSGPTDEEFQSRLAKLDVKNKKDDRLEALRWIQNQTSAKNAGLAVAALSKCIREDPEADHRRRAVEALGTIAQTRKEPCPLALVEAVRDKSDDVNSLACAWVGLFDKLAPGSVDVLLRCASSDNEPQRGDCLYSLVRAGGKDEKIIAAIDKLQKDKEYGVRHNAQIAMFQATDNLEQLLRYMIRVQQDPESMLSLLDKNSQTGKAERTLLNLVQIGGALRKIEWSETRADDYAAALMKLLKDASPVMRRGAAQDIGASAAKVDIKDIDPLELAPAKKKAEPKEPLQKSKVGIMLEKLKADERLRELRDNDPDESVRNAARTALERWQRVLKK